MNEELKRCGAQLLALQDVDAQRRDVADRLEALPQKRTIMALRAKQQEGAQRIALIEEKQAEAAQQEAILNVDLAAVETRIAEEQAKIDAATDHREVARLTQELDTLARRKDATEDKNLELLQKQQDLENLLTDTNDKIAALEQRERAEIAAYQEQATALKAELAALDAQRAQVAATLPGDVLERYDALAGQKGGVVVARFQKGRCQGCSIVPPTADRARIEASDEIEVCPHCRRLLVVEP